MTDLCWLGNQDMWISGSSWRDIGAPGLDIFGGYRCPRPEHLDKVNFHSFFGLLGKVLLYSLSQMC